MAGRVDGNILDDVSSSPPTSAATFAATGTSKTKLHWVRDVTCNEDRSRARHAPRAMASLRNLATSAHRQTGHTNSAQALRHTARNAIRALTRL